MDIPGKQFGMSGNESKFTRKFNFLIFLHILIMKIIVPIDDLAIDLFPGISKYSNNIETNLEEVKNLIADYYSYGAFKPTASIETTIWS